MERFYLFLGLLTVGSDEALCIGWLMRAII
jgi:hypothetical protein